jgi:hypothetical protein
MSRDPLDGDITNPGTLHKYLYAQGDPVNGMDPTGRVDEAEVGQIDLGIAARNAAAVYAVGVAVACELNVAASVLGGLAVQPTAPIKSITLNLASCSATVVKSERCQDLHKEVDHWKDVLSGFPGGASCS